MHTALHKRKTVSRHYPALSVVCIHAPAVFPCYIGIFPPVSSWQRPLCLQKIKRKQARHKAKSRLHHNARFADKRRLQAGMKTDHCPPWHTPGRAVLQNMAFCLPKGHISSSKRHLLASKRCPFATLCNTGIYAACRRLGRKQSVYNMPAVCAQNSTKPTKSTQKRCKKTTKLAHYNGMCATLGSFFAKIFAHLNKNSFLCTDFWNWNLFINIFKTLQSCQKLNQK